jgi:hypothetical protein
MHFLVSLSSTLQWSLWKVPRWLSTYWCIAL